MDKIFAQLPELQPATQPFELEKSDILVVAGGFEDRSRAFAIDMRAQTGAHALILDYIPADPRNQTAIISDALMKAGASIDIIKFNRWDGDDAWATLFSAISARADTHRRLVLDISGLTKIGIWLALESARQTNMDVITLYAEAKNYGPSFAEYRAAKKSKTIMQPSLQVHSGVQDVLRAEVLSSVAMQGQPICLVAFMSFNENFAQTLLNRINPSRLVLINGRPPMHTWREEATAWIHRRLLDEWPSDNKHSDGVLERTTSTLDYRETLDAISNIYWPLFASHRIILSPCGSKMQAIGAYIARAIHPDIHVESPVARGYLDQYSSGIGKKWVLKLGKISDLVLDLRREETSAHIIPDLGNAAD